MTSMMALASQAAKEAMRLRSALRIPPFGTVCPIDIAIELGIAVWLQALPSVEGIYSSGKRATIVVSTERPWGRIRHTCSHEIGHHVFRHGSSIDGLNQSNGGWQPEEYISDRFATALLMPKLAVTSALKRRRIDVRSLNPEQTFVLAQDFGVGYESFVSHLQRTLRLIESSSASRLRASGRKLQFLRCSVAGFVAPHDVFVADEHWGIRPLDIQSGDIVKVPSNATFHGRCAQIMMSPMPHLKGVAPGEGQLRIPNRKRAIRIRVCRRGFTGLAKYRHLEEYDEK